MTGNQNRVRAAAGLGAGALALAALALTSPTAAAAPADTTWTDGNAQFTMTVSNATPAVGDTITVSTDFQRKWADEYIYDVKTLVPRCLQYVDGSSTWQGGSVSKVEDASGADDQAYVKASAPNVTSWRVPGLGSGWGAKRTVTMQFTVTAACATGQAQGTSLHYGGSLGSGTYQNRGPSITVAEADNDNGNGDGGNGDGDGGDNGNGNGGDNGNGGNDNGNGGDNGGSGSLDFGSLSGLVG
ncbi:hypothetical protein [Gordonia caeni]|uniref:Uncharacterized protein n=1 Tax=Gordonia caeni TaxID=1007097 RepID=A0ABP7NNB9_9ACTN